jgi:hypothetical protein
MDLGALARLVAALVVRWWRRRRARYGRHSRGRHEVTDDDEDDPMGPFRAARIESRGQRPEHDDLPGGRRVLTGPQARQIARAKLAEWIDAHGRQPGLRHE